MMGASVLQLHGTFPLLYGWEGVVSPLISSGGTGFWWAGLGMGRSVFS